MNQRLEILQKSIRDVGDAKRIPTWFSFLTYLGLFQCIFLVLPVNWFHLLNFRVDLPMSGTVVGLVLFLLLPFLLIPLLQRLINIGFPRPAIELNPEKTEHEPSAEPAATHTENIPTRVLLTEREWQTLTILSTLLAGLCLGQFLMYWQVFNAVSVAASIFMNLAQFFSIAIALISLRLWRQPAGSDRGPFYAAIAIAVVYLFAYPTMQTLYLGMAVLMTCYLVALAILFLKILPTNTTAPFPEVEDQPERIGWVVSSLNKHCFAISYGWVWSLLWILALASLMGAMFAHTAVTGRNGFGYLGLVYIIAMGVGERFFENYATQLSERDGESVFHPNHQKRLILITLCLLIFNIGLTEGIPLLKNTVFDAFTGGLVMGMIIAIRLRYRAFNAYSEPTLLYGTPWSIFWATVLGYASILIGSFDEDFQLISARLLLVVLFFVNIILIVIIESIRFRMVDRKKSGKTPPRPKKQKVEKIKEPKRPKNKKQETPTTAIFNEPNSGWEDESTTFISPAVSPDQPKVLFENPTIKVPVEPILPKDTDKLETKTEDNLKESPPKITINVPVVKIAAEPSIKNFPKPSPKPSDINTKTMAKSAISEKSATSGIDPEELKQELIGKAEELDNQAEEPPVDPSIKIQIPITPIKIGLPKGENQKDDESNTSE
jgi:hypothetical protein